MTYRKSLENLRRHLHVREIPLIRHARTNTHSDFGEPFDEQTVYNLSTIAAGTLLKLNESNKKHVFRNTLKIQNTVLKYII